MKLFIDTDNKTFKVEGQVSFNELVTQLKKMLPEDWKEYKLDGGEVVSSVQPFWNPSSGTYVVNDCTAILTAGTSNSTAMYNEDIPFTLTYNSDGIANGLPYPQNTINEKLN